MKGRHSISIISRKASYHLVLERKVSILKGNSGTGKSSLIRLISEYLEYGKKSGVKVAVDSSASLGVLTNSSDWETVLSTVKNRVLFVDEDVDYIYTEAFQKELWGADCYVVIISRSGMFTGIPYAIFGIYELITEKNGENTATSMYQLYEEYDRVNNYDFILTEDSNSGFEMAKYAFGNDNIEVSSAGGNSSVLEMLIKRGRSYKNVCVNVDGAAFGAYIEPVLKYSEMRGDILVSAPESFEYVILNFTDVKRCLSTDCGELLRTYDYCEGTIYSTWEQFYENLLSQVTSENFGFVYSKRKLNHWFMNRKCAEQYVDIIRKCFVRRRK